MLMASTKSIFGTPLINASVGACTMRILLSSLSLSLLLHPLTAFGYAGFSIAAKVIRKALRKSVREGTNFKKIVGFVFVFILLRLETCIRVLGEGLGQKDGRV
jgi:hypothetical protein